MPSVENQTTKQLLQAIGAAPLNGTQQAALTELLFREIKNGDPDELEVGGLETTKGGVRPHHAPLVP
jgi:hypothetical protein